MKLPRFQFRLRTLMIAVTLLAGVCAYVTNESKIVQERRAAWGRSGIELSIQLRNEDEYGVLNWVRRALGDRVAYRIYATEKIEPAEIARVHALFPEADIRLFDPKAIAFVASDVAGPLSPSNPRQPSGPTASTAATPATKP